MRKLFCVLALAALVACANPFNAANVRPGETREEVLAKLGRPTRVVPLPQGERLQYSGQPFGQYAWMVDLDPSGRVTGVRQTLNAIDFARIVPGQWTLLDVQREFGPPALVEGVSSWNGPILTYRWLDADRAEMFYYVYLDSANVVRRAHPAMEFRSSPNDHS
ncbi:MAG TPA: hypothetical protein VFE82_01380 [Ramlibacter sp.]|jgi:hypothetical protein|uniref:hypothetical protein n=1 Tax=Ramlibacter sp. TaxID=1917967 RepID=UPI002D3AEDE3|nr:hypothetical protein [Ramlibacter sp.]HZY17098.1 hypothetical protein [Ramlibacter sp.]